MAAVKKKNPGKAGRPAGTNDLVRTARRVVSNRDTIAKEVSLAAPEALQLLLKTMRDPSEKSTITRGIAELILKMQERFYEEFNDRTEPKVRDSENIKEETEGKIVPFFSTEYTPSPDKD